MELYDDPHYPNLGVIKPKRAFIVTTEGKILGQEVRTRLDSLRWYQKIWARIFRRYRNRFIDYRGFELESRVTKT